MISAMNSADPLIQDILSKIDFRLLPAHIPGSLFDTASLTEVTAYKGLDVANTQIWDRDTKLFTLEFLRTPRLSTVAIAYIINRLVQYMPKDQAYLNIGVWCGFSLFAGMIGNEDKQCIGVDNFSDPRSTKSIFERQYNVFKNEHSQFYEMDYLEYFRTVHKEPIGVYFYDGDHSYEHQYTGLEVADSFLTTGSYVLVDDTNTEAPYDATMSFVEKHGGQYTVVLDAKTANNGHPTFWDGLLILKKT